MEGGARRLLSRWRAERDLGPRNVNSLENRLVAVEGKGKLEGRADPRARPYFISWQII
jgi:hypothetical protein